ncbi:hypothetical protein Patl1_29859 [Pistacia atlantica]|uniref:Uncharacterized protein n=1 Tax=Pistacia atlantica TaxID=434234 RepID=A0ACC1ABG3_9ROSI|nr:hypothetical protein Patl1_29859 [Pistacia atlantica]
MKAIHRALVTVFALILVFLLMFSLVSPDHEGHSHYRERNKPRRLLGSVTSLSANLNKLHKAVNDPQKAMETSLKKAPPSESNPSQNNAIAISRGEECWKKKLPLCNGRADSSVNSKAFIKYEKIDANAPPLVPGNKNLNLDAIPVTSGVLLGSLVFVNVVLISAFCPGFFFINKKKFPPAESTMEINYVASPTRTCGSYR